MTIFTKQVSTIEIWWYGPYGIDDEEMKRIQKEIERDPEDLLCGLY